MKNIISVLWERGFQVNTWSEDIDSFIKYFVDNIKKNQSKRQIERYIFLMGYIFKIDECSHKKLKVEAEGWYKNIENGKIIFICYDSKGKVLIEENEDQKIKLLFICDYCCLHDFISVKINELVLEQSGDAYIFNYNKKSEKGLKPKIINPQKTKITSSQRTKLFLNMIMCKGLLKEKGQNDQKRTNN